MAKDAAWAGGLALLAVGFPASSAVARALLAAGFDVERSDQESAAFAAIERRAFAAVLLGPRLDVSSTRRLLGRAVNKNPALPVIILPGVAALQDAVDCMQLGAADYLAPPFDPAVVVDHVRRLLDTKPSAKSPPAAAPFEALGLFGKSPAMAKVFATIEKVSRYKANVLLLGESGTGKELIARALHARGPRRQHLFVPVNCATLGRDLLENELFGHERGAFTGAQEQKRGLFELANGGTLFLDEIGELDPSTQAKLLRVLERNAFRRVGGTSLVIVNLSVIAATNRNLEEAIAAKRFREDLYYRLKVVTIVVPALRERREDIPALAQAFIADFNRRNGGMIRTISPQGLLWLGGLPWHGNVRELKNTIESAAMLSSTEIIGLDELESSSSWGRTQSAGPASTRAAIALEPVVNTIAVPSRATLSAVERTIIVEHLKRAKTRVEAAQSLGIGVRTLYSKIKMHRLADVDR
jgi:DNA-binding NtrC family response regulator